MAHPQSENPYADFIEAAGVRWEAEGFPRIAGRIFGFMFVQEQPASLDELAAALGVSKASVSTDARRLEQVGLLVRVGQPGDRRDFYKMPDDVAARALELKLASMRRFDELFRELGQAPPLGGVAGARAASFENAQRRVVAALEQILGDLRSASTDPLHHQSA